MNSSCSVSTRSMPARRIAASKTMSEPASAPVCEAAALHAVAGAAGLDDDHRLVARRGARRRHELARRLDRFDVEQDRARVRHRWRGGRAGRRSRRRRARRARHGAKSRSGATSAQSSTAVTSAPDCETKATLPASASVCAKLALRPRCGVSRPMQFGPRMRSRCGRAASSIACFCAAPSRPAVMTIAARVPRRPKRGDQARHRRGRRAEDRQVGHLRQVGRQREARHAVERGVLGVDGEDRAGEAAGAQVAPDRRADAAGAVRGADDARSMSARAGGRDGGCSRSRL